MTRTIPPITKLSSIIADVAKETNTHVSIVRKLFNAVVEKISNTVMSGQVGNAVRVREFGTFKKIIRKPRAYNNPLTQQKWISATKECMSFKQSKKKRA